MVSQAIEEEPLIDRPVVGKSESLTVTYETKVDAIVVDLVFRAVVVSRHG